MRLDASTVKRFAKGTRVRSMGGAITGRFGTVYHPVKTRGVICVEFDNHRRPRGIPRHSGRGGMR